MVCQSSLFALAQKRRVVKRLGFFKTASEWGRLFGLTTNFVSKEGVWFACLTQQLSLQLEPSVAVLNSVMKHAQTGKKPKKMTVILNTRNGLLQDLYKGEKKKLLVL